MERGGLTRHTTVEKVKKTERDLQFADTLPLLFLPPEFPKSFAEQARVEAENYLLCMSLNSATHKTIHHYSRLLELIDHSNCLGENLLVSIH